MSQPPAHEPGIAPAEDLKDLPRDTTHHPRSRARVVSCVRLLAPSHTNDLTPPRLALAQSKLPYEVVKAVKSGEKVVNREKRGTLPAKRQ
jgi:hypothetical protein